jgi:hypothetical protein
LELDIDILSPGILWQIHAIIMAYTPELDTAVRRAQFEKRSFEDFCSDESSSNEAHEELVLVIQPAILLAFEDRISKNQANLEQNTAHLEHLLTLGEPTTPAALFLYLKRMAAREYVLLLSAWDLKRKKVLKKVDWSRREKILELNDELYKLERLVGELRQVTGKQALRLLKMEGDDERMWTCKFQWEWLVVFKASRSLAVVGCRFGPWYVFSLPCHLLASLYSCVY